MPKQQKSRTPKTSKGTGVGARKTRLTEVEKALFGGGCVKTVTQKRTKRARLILQRAEQDAGVIAADYS